MNDKKTANEPKVTADSAILKSFLEEQKRKHLEYLGLYKNYDDEVRKINDEIEEIERPMHDLDNMQKLFEKLDNEGFTLEGYEPSDYEYIWNVKCDLYKFKEHIDVVRKIFNIITEEGSFIRAIEDLNSEMTYYEIGLPRHENEQESEKEAYDFIVEVQKEYIISIIESINLLNKKHKSYKFYEIINDTMTEVSDALMNYIPSDFDQIDNKINEMTHAKNALDKLLSVIKKCHFPNKKCTNKFYDFHDSCEGLVNIFNHIIFGNYHGFEFKFNFIFIKKLLITKGIERPSGVRIIKNQDAEKEAYDFIVNVQKEYIESIIESMDKLREKYNHVSFFKKMNDNIISRLYDALKNYNSIDFDRMPQSKVKIDELKKERENKYYQENGHWYAKYAPKRVIEISSSEYDELCKIYPPHLVEQLYLLRKISKDGYDKGYNKGYNKGYSCGYDEGFDKGYGYT